jgi:hypothetical protein
MDLDLQCQMQLFLGLFERELNPWLRRLAQDTVTAIDVGAGCGEYVLYVLLNAGGQRVFAFEPLSNERAAMASNLNLNGLAGSPRVVISGKYIGERDDLEMVTLDSLEHLISEPCLVKIDVEGHEVSVLRGASKLLAMERIRWIVEVHSQSNEVACLVLLGTAGLKTRIVSQAWWRALIPEQRPVEHNRWIVAWRDSVGA